MLQWEMLKKLALDILHVIQRLCSHTARTTEQPLPNSWFSVHFGLRGENKNDDVPCICWNFLGATQLKTNEKSTEIDYAWKMIHFLKRLAPFSEDLREKKIRVDFHLRNLLYIDTKHDYKVKRSHLFPKHNFFGIQPLVFLGGNSMMSQEFHTFAPPWSHLAFFSFLPWALGEHKRSLYLFLGCSRWRELVRNPGKREGSKFLKDEVESESWRRYCVFFWSLMFV